MKTPKVNSNKVLETAVGVGIAMVVVVPFLLAIKDWAAGKSSVQTV